VGPVPNPLLLRKSGSAGNRTLTSGSVARNSDHRSGHTQATTAYNLKKHPKSIPVTAKDKTQQEICIEICII
jgi:hypothetical protein